MRKIRKKSNTFLFVKSLRVVVLSMAILFLSAGVVYSKVPDDQLPVPFEHLQFWNNVFDISGWPATRTLHSVWIEGDYLYFPNEGACSWASTDGIVNTNVHIVLEHKGEWVASSWDYTRICQESKHYDAIGDIPYDGWKPQVGTTYYFFLTGVSRDYSGGLCRNGPMWLPMSGLGRLDTARSACYKQIHRNTGHGCRRAKRIAGRGKKL